MSEPPGGKLIMSKDSIITSKLAQATPEQIRMINNKILQEVNPQLKTTQSTLCWLCKHCTGGVNCPCSKVNDNEPVDGWTAEQSDIYPDEAAWRVIACPLFDFNSSLRWDLQTYMPILKHWLQTTNGKPLYDMAIFRDPARWVDEYNAVVPRDMQIDPRMPEEAAADEEEYETADIDPDIAKKIAALSSDPANFNDLILG